MNHLLQEYMKFHYQEDSWSFVDDIVRQKAYPAPDYVRQIAEASFKIAEAGCVLDEAMQSIRKEN